MMNNEEPCPETQEYLDWFDKEAVPHIEKLRAHFSQCLKCQQIFLSTKDKMALNLLLLSDEEALQRIKEKME